MTPEINKITSNTPKDIKPIEKITSDNSTDEQQKFQAIYNKMMAKVTMPDFNKAFNSDDDDENQIDSEPDLTSLLTKMALPINLPDINNLTK
ncbi:MAG: hypothetical protein WC860_01915 [Candidatus Margulisiibacteriota bacterium]|jgi:hypothetical protein